MVEPYTPLKHIFYDLEAKKKVIWNKIQIPWFKS